MKMIGIVLLLFFTISAKATDQGYLSGTNTVTLAEGDSLVVLGNLKYDNISIKVVLPPYDTPFQETFSITIYNSTDIAGRTFPGPCKIMPSSNYHNFGYKITRAGVTTCPMNVITLPPENNGDVQLLIESSTDLETWTPVYSGSAGTAGSSAFFRTRLISQ
ncbi:hypothetical protein PDESU_00372 [Pontiella desulfatans]|uniref:Uncharacterized protein n=1 Tax=Pontiella desulfatans TaxID=2750659 RepID=A0A6C2TVY0_PONDE|nr:hypothetical protein [Pontiella desulfatans]VGO11825.1 hypothetical protein PDESU_00372 [Pontiella desulfatans]